MYIFNKKTWTLLKEKDAGKNAGGFYKDPEGNKHFVKIPADKGELFAELFVGLILEEMKKRKLIDEIYFPSLICADLIKFEDNSYGLIQPLMSFEELHKIIGTTKSDGSDRDPTTEALSGPNYYPVLTQKGTYFGLSIALMFSLLFGAHSVHSGNIVALNNDDPKSSRQYARIDWGDAFRYFNHHNNNDNLLWAYENRGFFNYKQLTKDYFLNYKKIVGLFPAMAKKSQQLQEKMTNGLFVDIVISALKQIPADLLDMESQQKFAKYMTMPSFAKVTFGHEANFQPFAEEFAQLLEKRLGKITELQDLTKKESEAAMYQSTITVPPISLSFDDKSQFPTTMLNWTENLSKNKGGIIDGSKLDLQRLASHFNQYLDHIANQCETSNIWESDQVNIFTPFYEGKGTQEHGHAFVSQYKESTILRRLFTIDLKTLNLRRFAAFEKPVQVYSDKNKDSLWFKIQSMATSGQAIINTLKMIQQAQAFGLDDALTTDLEVLKAHLDEFNHWQSEVNSILGKSIPSTDKDKNGSSFFYSIADSELNEMTGDQLATICLEELNSPRPSPLIERIIKEDALWSKMDEAFARGEFDARTDKPRNKIAKLHSWHELLQISKAELISLKKELKQIHEQYTQLLTSSKLEIAKKSQQTSQLEDTIKQQKELNQKLEKLKETAEISVSMQEEKLKQLDAHAKKLQHQLSLREAKDTAVSKQLEQIKALEKQVEQLESQSRLQLQEHQEQLEKLKLDSGQQVDLLKKQILEKESAILQIEKKLEQTDDLNKQFDAQLQASEKEKTSLKSTVESLKQSQKELEHQIAESDQKHRFEITTLTKQLEGQQHKASEAESAFKQQKELNEKLDKTKSEAENTVRLQEDKLQQLSEQIDNLQLVLSFQEGKDSALLKQLEQVKQLEAQSKLQLQEHQKQLEKLKLDSSKEGELLKKQIHEKEDQILQIKKEFEQITNLNQHLHSQLQLSEEEKTSLKSSLESLQHRNTQLKAQIAESGEKHELEITALRKQLEGAQLKASEAENAFKQQKELNQQLEKTKSEAENTVRLQKDKLKQLSEQIENLQLHLPSQEGKDSALLKQLEQVKQLEAQSKLQLQEHQKQLEKLKLDSSKEGELLKKKIHENEATIFQIKTELEQVTDLNKHLHSQLQQSEKEKTSLKSALESLQLRYTKLEAQIAESGQNHKLEISSLTKQLEGQQLKSNEAESALKQQKEINQQLEKTKSAAEKAVTLQKEELNQLKAQTENLQRQLASRETKDPVVSQPPGQNRDTEHVEAIKEEIRKQKLKIGALEKIISESQAAESKFNLTLHRKQDIYFARMERMAPILIKIEDMAEKAKELRNRNEIDAFNAATNLVKDLRSEIKEYAENTEQDETDALDSFKIDAKQHIEKARAILSNHREEWKYILGNITLGIMLVGIGYGAAILINKCVTGNYTFFSKTNSDAKLDNLEKMIYSNNTVSVGAG